MHPLCEQEVFRHKRSKGKLPGKSTIVLKEWWDEHDDWPYPKVGMHGGAWGCMGRMSVYGGSAFLAMHTPILLQASHASSKLLSTRVHILNRLDAVWIFSCFAMQLCQFLPCLHAGGG